jgi:hypothetical protein
MSESTSNSPATCAFSFRVWLQPEGGDPPEIEVWYQGLEPTSDRYRSVTQWCKEALQDHIEWYETFSLDPAKCWQIVGKADLRGWCDNNGEYEEELTFYDDSIEKAEVPENWFEVGCLIEGLLSLDEASEANK